MAQPKHDWYLREWLTALGRKQADIVRDLDWNKARVSLMVSGQQQYNRDAVNEMAAYLHLHPHELLMHPSDAMALRGLRDNVARLVAGAEEPRGDENIGRKVRK